MIKTASRLLVAALVLASVNAHAATSVFSIVVTSPPSTAVNCVVSYPAGQTSFVTPVAVGTLVAACTITPATWSGVLTLTGADASLFNISGSNVVVGAAALTVARTYNLTVTAAP
jgi:hypothetical protein